MIHVGSRVNKYWFIVQDAKSQTDAILSVMPWSEQCILPVTKSTKTLLADLFAVLQVNQDLIG